jgi:hypothetical protein
MAIVNGSPNLSGLGDRRRTAGAGMPLGRGGLRCLESRVPAAKEVAEYPADFVAEGDFADGSSVLTGSPRPRADAAMESFKGWVAATKRDRRTSASVHSPLG